MYTHRAFLLVSRNLRCLNIEEIHILKLITLESRGITEKIINKNP